MLVKISGRSSPRSFSSLPPNSDGRVQFELIREFAQAIVKIASIRLTPENLRYPGSSRLVESIPANEKLVATALYCYASKNLAEPRLSFRTIVGELTDGGIWMPYELSNYQRWHTAFGFAGAGGPGTLNQVLEHIVAEEDKRIAFSDICRTHGEPFELAYASNPGYRKILCFFLRGPGRRVTCPASRKTGP
ncbi:hypothetical protein FKP32DRAFT_1595014 [Trametes sanguinea]|nr:hypothetical protein FKP32DRAFT_1595014 [Trametes sanguinea]